MAQLAHGKIANRARSEERILPRPVGDGSLILRPGASIDTPQLALQARGKNKKMLPSNEESM